MIISVIVPVYNMAADGMLAYCLDSLCNQTVEDIEIIAVNDASTDNSPEILEEYRKKYPGKLSVYSLPVNSRQGAAKNEGLKHAKGEYIAFVDSDDWLSPDALEKLLNKAKETGADMVGCDFCLVYEHTMTPTERVACNKAAQTGIIDHDKRASLIQDPGALVTKLYKRALLFDEPFAFPEKMFFEDNAVGIELIRRAKHFEYIEEPLYFYYQHSTSTVHVITKERCEDRLEAMRIMYRYAKEKGYLEEFYPELEYKFMNLYYQNTLFGYMQTTKKVDMGFIDKMGREMREYFPDFEKNVYYVQNINPEEKKLMHMQQQSTVYFVMYYKLLYFYRNTRKKLKAIMKK